MKKINMAMFSFLMLICIIALISPTEYRKVTRTISYGYTSKYDGISGLYIPTDSKGAIGDKIYVELYADPAKISNISLFLKPTVSNGGTIVYLKSNSKDITRKPYFIIPSDVVVGEKYELTQVNVYKEDGTVDSYSTTSGGDYPSLDSGSKRYFTILEKSEEKEEEPEVDLTLFDFPINQTKEIEKIPIDLSYEGQIDWASISFESVETSSISFSVAIQDINNGPYINLKNNNSFPGPGEYKVKQVFLCSNKSGCTIFSSDDSFTESISYDFDKNLIIEKVEEEEPTQPDPDGKEEQPSSSIVNNISFSSKNVSFGEKVNINIKSSSKLESVLLFLEDNNKKTLSVYVKELNSSPYIVIPSNLEDGIYHLSSAIIKTEDQTTEYYTNKDNSILDLNSSITINNLNTNTTNQLIINNDSYKEEDYKSQFENLDEDAIITVSASSNSMIDSSLFDVIKETRRKLIIEYKDSEWVFSGTDIKETKPIDASIIITSLEKSDIYDSKIAKEVPSETKVVSFVNNGELPGKVLMRIKSSAIDELFKNKNVNVYYYDKDEDEIEKVAMEVQKNDGSYEFYINHNSSYLISSKTIDDKYISKDTTLLEMNTEVYKDVIIEEEKETSIDPITILLLIIVILLIIIFIVSSLKGKKDTDDDYYS